MRFLMIIGGSVSLAVGTLGIFLPGLPTTVFVLIAAWLFVRSSPQLPAAPRAAARKQTLRPLPSRLV